MLLHTLSVVDSSLSKTSGTTNEVKRPGFSHEAVLIFDPVIALGRVHTILLKIHTPFPMPQFVRLSVKNRPCEKP